MSSISRLMVAGLSVALVAAHRNETERREEVQYQRDRQDKYERIDALRRRISFLREQARSQQARASTFNLFVGGDLAEAEKTIARFEISNDLYELQRALRYVETAEHSFRCHFGGIVF